MEYPNHCVREYVLGRRLPRRSSGLSNIVHMSHRFILHWILDWSHWSWWVAFCPDWMSQHTSAIFTLDDPTEYLYLSIQLKSGCNVWLITIWKEKSPAVLQFYHFMFGVGAMVAPFGAEPFLGKKLQPPFIEYVEHSLNSPHFSQKKHFMNIFLCSRFQNSQQCDKQFNSEPVR